MSISVGDRLPNLKLHMMSDGKPTAVDSDEIFKGKRVVLFAVPGAFTPTCSAAHLPGFVVHADDLRGKGVDQIVCLSVNDAFVMDAWGQTQNVEDRLLMLADGNGDFTRSLGLETDSSAFGMGTRSQRYSMLVEDGIVKSLNIDPPRTFQASSAESMLKQLG
ncbi:MAG: peroxiredoxin [Candidatus Competibacteraceae bacterium]|nr:peroxiredoxin [Candidatus Competibacteraceae bacterium]